jgi:outer membrane protein OmpA-like peptidoglycan-associated protein
MMTMRPLSYFLHSCLALSLAATAASSQTADIARLGLTGSVTLNMHSGALDTRDGLLECGSFDGANTVSWMAGNAVWVPLAPSFALQGRLQYWKADGTFTAPNDVQPNVALPDGSLVRMESEYELRTSLDYVTLDVMALWYVAGGFFVAAGPQIGFNTRASFEQAEVILEPSFLQFTQGGRERTFLASTFEQNGTSANLRIALATMIGYDLRVHPSIVVTPELGYNLGITSVLNTNDWKVSALRGGVTVSWAFLPAPEPVIKEVPVMESAPTVIAQIPPPPIRTMRVHVESETTDGATLPGADIVITEHRSSDVVPLLPFVFFDKASATIPSRYRSADVATFNEGELRDSVLGVYHHLLNIVGARMRTYPDATLSVGGYREPADGEDQESLSTQRAETVKNYLVNVWKISPQRITTSTGVLPTIVSNRTIDDGRTENRRAELSSNDPRILAPVTMVNIQPRYGSTELPATAEATITVNGKPVAGPLNVDEKGVKWTVDGNTASAALGKASSSTGIIEMTATFDDGTVVQDAATLTARRLVRSKRFSNDVVNDSIIERFRLIFFDYDKPSVSDFNRSMIDLIRSRIRTTSSMRVTGLTDRIGPNEHNVQLSRRRAESIERTIKERIVPERSSVEGAGPMLIYNNDLPEGRWYNRTVLIEVATPVEEP